MAAIPVYFFFAQTLFLFHILAIMPFGHITPVRMVVCRLMVYLFKFFLNNSIELLEIMFDGRAFHSLAVVGKKTMSECVGRVSNLKKLAVMFFVSDEYCV